MTTPANYQILLDQDGKPIPQYFVPDEGFKPLLGTEDVAPHYILVDESGTIQEDFFTNATFADVMGEVQATPTANTNLGRLKAIEDKLDGIKDTDGIKKITDTVNTQLTGSNVLYDGTKSIGGTAEELGSDQDVLELMVQADPDNTEDIFVGNATSQSVKLKPGQSYEMSMANLNLVYVKADSGTQTVNYHARGES